MDLTRRRDFLRVAALFEGSLVLVALAVGWLFGVNPLSTWRWDAEAAGWGALAALPMFALFVLSMRFPWGPFGQIKRFLIESLGPALAECRWYHLLLVAVLAGVGEELLFRGVLQPLIGLTWSNVLFGLAHCITVTYALLAGVIGLYLGWLFQTTDNLLAPVITHSLYDFLAFLVLAHHCKGVPQPRQPLLAPVFDTTENEERG